MAEERKQAGGKGLKGGLTAMGTAAVLGVYAAGYVRTEGAAQRMEAELAARRLAVAHPLVTRPVALSPLVTPAPPPAPGEAAPAPKADADTPAPVATRAPADSSTPEPAAEIAAAEAPPAEPPAPEEPAAPESPYKDGVYNSSGWETRHGHVEVSVEIAGGKIASASIVWCGMRWPCSEVNSLVARVTQLQTSEVGMISGATQTSEAFTSAVAQALTLAAAARTRPAAE